MKSRKRRRRAWMDALFVLTFLAATGTPLVSMLSPRYRVHPAGERPDDAPTVPPRILRLIPRPLRGTAQSARVFMHNFKVSFALRKSLVRLNALVRVRWMKTSSLPLVVVGKDGWLFYTANNSVGDYRRLFPWNGEQLRAPCEFFQKIEVKLRRRHIKFLVVIAPDKHSIYPEEMPDELKPVAGPTHLDQFVEAMKATRVEVLDLRPAFGRAKAAHLVYSRTDTHWNAYGSLAAYQATAARLKLWFPNLQITPPQGFQVRTLAPAGGDLAHILGLSDDIHEPQFEIEPRMRQLWPREKIVDIPAPGVAPFVRKVWTQRAGGEIGRALVLGDSFTGTQWRPLLSQHFARGLWCHRHVCTDYDDQLVAQFQPDVVIFEIVERSLLELNVSPNL